MMRPLLCGLALAALALPASRATARQAAADSVRVSRLARNPLITVESSPTLGGNVNGPTIIRVPDWVQRPLGKYYMYFANHRGDFIRLAYANDIAGPWTVYEPGVQHVRETAFFRPQPDLARFGGFATHLASPEIFVDTAHRRIVMWSHGWWTNGERWPSEPRAAQQWAADNGYGQFTQAAVSTDGLHFTAQPALTKDSYLRAFQHAGEFYAFARLGRLFRAADPLSAFEPGPDPFRDTPYANRVRHVALLVRGNRLYVFFTAIGDAPERMLMSTIDLAPDWTDWRITTPVEVLQPETGYECANLPVAKSEVGDVEVPVRQIRDPFLFQDRGRTILFYSTCGEQGIAAADITIP